MDLSLIKVTSGLPSLGEIKRLISRRKKEKRFDVGLWTILDTLDTVTKETLNTKDTLIDDPWQLTERHSKQLSIPFSTKGN